MPTRGTYSGLKLWIVEGHIRYEMKIWHNFKGYSYYKYDLMADKKGKAEKFYGYAPRDYATAFVYLRSHFGME